MSIFFPVAETIQFDVFSLRLWFSLAEILAADGLKLAGLSELLVVGRRFFAEFVLLCLVEENSI